MIIVTTDSLEGKNLEMLGLVRGSVVYSKHIGKDIVAAFKMLFGGEVFSYTELLNEARAIATKRMVEDAEKLGADAIVGMRYASSLVMQGAAEIVAYGTAVRFR